MEYVYAFRYSSCTHEERMCVISLHLTKEGAEKALEAHMAESKADWESAALNDSLMDDELMEFWSEWRKEHPWTEETGRGSERWDVVRMEIQK